MCYDCRANGGDQRNHLGPYLRRYACFKCRIAFKNITKCPECQGDMEAMSYRWSTPLRTQKKKWEQSRRFIVGEKESDPQPAKYQFIPKRIKSKDV